VVFAADIVFGIVTPTFSLFARDLGISVALLGLLVTAGGVTQLVASVPLGLVSDRVGRTRVITGGLVAFALSMIALALADGPALVAVGRILQGIAVIACFQIATAYLGDITTPGERAMAFGSFAAAMGLGFTVGPLLGGQLADRWDFRVSYGVAALIALSGAWLARGLLREPPVEPALTRRVWWSDIGLVASRHDLILVGFGNLLVSFTFVGAISTFLPLYARAAHISAGTIGTMFAIRALVSAAGRIPNGIVTRAVGNLPILLGALVAQALVLLAIRQTTDMTWMTILLACDGLAFGAYLVAGQTWVADRTEAVYRGAAVGLYGALGSVGGIAGPLLLGVVADRWGVAAVFLVNGWLMVAGTAVIAAGTALLLRHGGLRREQDAAGREVPLSGRN
jgi:MFS family permease